MLQVNSLVIQMELIQCGWATLLDDEPFPEPKQNLQYSNEQEYLGGWKLVGGITVTGSNEDEGSMVFPSDQIYLVKQLSERTCTQDDYIILKTNGERLLRSLHSDRQYLIWFPHLMWKDDFKAAKMKEKVREAKKKRDDSAATAVVPLPVSTPWNSHVW